jgi:Flp pilus assembly protein TadD
MMGETASRRAQRLYEEGALTEAAQVLSDAIGETETSTLWNDWGVVQCTLGEVLDAEKAFRRALALEPTCRDATTNLGALLFGVGRRTEAEPFLKRGLETAVGPGRATLTTLLAQCEEVLHEADSSH